MGLPVAHMFFNMGNQEDNMVGKLMAGFAVSEREVSRRADNNTSTW